MSEENEGIKKEEDKIEETLENKEEQEDIVEKESYEESGKKTKSSLESTGCHLCKHPAKDQITECYLDNNRDIELTKAWFFNKFKRNFRDSIWTRHFNEHVEPHLKTFDLVRKKRLDELVEKTLDAKKDTRVSPVAMIKQMLFDFMLDSYMAKPNKLVTKEEKIDFMNMAKNISLLAKSYKDYQAMEMEMLAYGKTEEEQKQAMKNYMSSMVNNILRLFDGDLDAQEKISAVFGISPDVGKKTDKVDFELD